MRVERWEDVLVAYLEQKQHEVFRWGTNDCVLFTADYLDTITDSSLYSLHVGKYENEAEAMAYLATLGFATTEELATSFLPIKPVKLAQRGDIMMLTGGALGICDGRRSYFFTENDGLIAMPTLKCLKAWGV